MFVLEIKFLIFYLFFLKNRFEIYHKSYIFFKWSKNIFGSFEFLNKSFFKKWNNKFFSLTLIRTWKNWFNSIWWNLNTNLKWLEQFQLISLNFARLDFSLTTHHFPRATRGHSPRFLYKTRSMVVDELP